MSWRARGAAILMVSSEMAELLQVADRILVMRQGRISGEFTAPAATQEQIMRCAAFEVEHCRRRGASRMIQRLLPFFTLIAAVHHPFHRFAEFPHRH